MKKFKKWLKQFQKENDRSPTIEEVYDEATKTIVVEHFEAYGQCRDSRRIADLENKLANVSYQLEGREVELKELQEELSACKFAMAMSEKVEKQLREQIEKMKCIENCATYEEWKCPLQEHSSDKYRPKTCQECTKWKLKE